MRHLLTILLLTACAPEATDDCDPPAACVDFTEDRAYEMCLRGYDLAVIDGVYDGSHGEMDDPADPSHVGYRAGRSAYEAGEACPSWAW